MQSQEDEEERVAADAEKRKRLMGRSISTNTAEDSSLRRAKILMLGDSGVGKSSLMLRWTLDTFKTSLTSTVGVNFKSRRVKANDEYIQVQVWDTAGQEQFHKITTSYYKGAQAIMLVYDITDQGTLDNVEYWVKNIKAHASDSVQVVLVGNKTDLRNSDPNRHYVRTEHGKDVALKFGIPFFETSAKESVNVDSAFSTLVEHTLQSWAGCSPPKQQYFPSNNGGRAHSSSGVPSSSSSSALSDHHSSASSSRNRMGNNNNNNNNNYSSGNNNSDSGNGGSSGGGSNGKGGGFAKVLSRKSIESGVSRIIGSIRDNLSRENSFGEKKTPPSSVPSTPSSSLSSLSPSGSHSRDLLGSAPAPINGKATPTADLSNNNNNNNNNTGSGGFASGTAATNDRVGCAAVEGKEKKDKNCTPS